MPSALLQIVTTTAEKADAEALAQALLDRRLAACVQISGPIESRYWWNNRLETAAEWTVTIKTHRDRYAEVQRLLLELHPYDEPEIMAFQAVEVSPGYARWLGEQLQQPPKAETAAKAEKPAAAKSGARKSSAEGPGGGRTTP